MLARERTFAAWMRTGLTAIGAGFIIAKLRMQAQPHPLAIAIGIALMLGGAVIQGVGLGNYRATVVRMEELGERHEPFWLVAVVAIMVMLSALAGIALLLIG